MMKASQIAFILTCFFLISWGVRGHRAIGLIAEHHLSDAAKVGIRELIGDTSLATVSTYADEIRSTYAYRYTAPWHYINLKSGLNFEQFADSVQHFPGPNVYTALSQCEKDLRSTKTKQERAFALKWIVHLVGDLHQPMHVSRSEDKGGNAIRVTFNGKQSNLHRLWDTDLIEHQGVNESVLARQTDKAGATKIKKLQRADLTHWLFESYQISSALYAEVASDSTLSERYYKAHKKIIKRRLLQAGIRLAGVLNEAFEPTNAPWKK